MTSYNTGNPIGSKDPRDLYDNAENLDEAVNTRTAESWDDRLGVARKTWWGMEQDFQKFLINSGYEDIGDYASGLEITARNQIFRRDGELYRAGEVLELPYTTTGDWSNEEGLFVAVGDAALRQELANPAMGAAMVSGALISSEELSDAVYAAEGMSVGRHFSVAGRGIFTFDTDPIGPVNNVTSASVGGGFLNLREGVLRNTFTLRVPEDFPDIQSAFDFLKPYRPESGLRIEIRISSDYEVSKGVALIDSDYSYVRLTSADPVVSVSSDFEGVSPVSDPLAANSLIALVRSSGPTVECLFNMGGFGGCGITVTQFSRLLVGGGAGVIHAGAFGLYVSRSSWVRASQANFTYANWGNRVTVNSFLSAPQANFGGAKQGNYRDGAGTTANLDVSRGSVVYITGTPEAKTSLVNGAGHGLHVRRSYVSATHVNCGGNQMNGVLAGAGAIIAFTGSFANNNLGSGIAAGDAMIFAASTQASENGSYNVFATSGARIAARDISAPYGGVNGLRADHGGEIIATGGNCRREAGVNGDQDIVVTNGGSITATGASGGTNISPLTLTANGVIIK